MRMPGIFTGSAIQRMFALGGLGCAVLSGACSGTELPAKASPPHQSSAPARSVPILSPPRYQMAPIGRWIERGPDGIDRLISGGSRIEVRETQVIHTTDDDSDIENGTAVPAFCPSTTRYLFWKGRDLFGAQSFTGPLTKIGSVRSTIRSAFDWVDGVGLITEDGVSRFRAASASLEPFPLPGVVSALASTEKQGIAFTSFAHAYLTQDGGKTFQDISTELGDANDLEIRGDRLTITLAGSRRRAIQPTGEIIEVLGQGGQKRGARPPHFDENWPPSLPQHPLDDLGESAIPLENGEILVVAKNVVGYMDASTGHIKRSLEIEQATGRCTPLALPDHILLLCADKERATVIQLGVSPRVERTFDIFDTPDADRFAASDGEALGFLGPCKGVAKPEFQVDTISNATPYNGSPSRSSVFCVRKSASEWIEHSLNPTDASDVVAWVPRTDGGAVALVARPGTFIEDAERKGGNGMLRIIRMARNEPPLSLPQYGYRSSELLTRSLHVLPDASLEGWLPTTVYPANQIAIHIDSEGRIHPRAFPPQISALQTAGPFGLTQNEDGAFYETTDWGASWLRIDSPPISALQRLLSCSPAGCRIGPVVRIGWLGPTAPPILSPTPSSSAAFSLRALRERSYRRPPPPPPLVRLQCSPTTTATGARLPDSYAFGYTPTTVQRSQFPTRIQGIGALMLPWSGSQFIAGGDADLSWIPIFELGASVRRATINTNNLGLTDMRYRPYEVRLGFVIDGEGRVETIAAGPKDNCIANVLDKVGITTPIGGCAPEYTLGVRLDRRALLLSSRFGTHTLTSVDFPASGAAPAMRELGKITVPMGSYGYSMAVGSRAKQPVAIAVDGGGQAVLSPIDSTSLRFGPEEQMAPLTALALGNEPSCAPSPDQARVILSFDHELGLGNDTPGLAASGNFGLAILRWSSSKVCLDAIELGVRDERYEADIGYYDPPGTVRKLVAIFGKNAPTDSASKKTQTQSSSSQEKQVPPLPKGEGNAALTLVLHGTEIRQRLQCTGRQP